MTDNVQMLLCVFGIPFIALNFAAGLIWVERRLRLSPSAPILLALLGPLNCRRGGAPKGSRRLPLRARAFFLPRQNLLIFPGIVASIGSITESSRKTIHARLANVR